MPDPKLVEEFKKCIPGQGLSFGAEPCDLWSPWDRGKGSTRSPRRSLSVPKRKPSAMGVASRRGSSHEPVRKGAHTSYKARDKKTKQAELFPKLLEEIEKKRRERLEGKSFTAEERFRGRIP